MSRKKKLLLNTLTGMLRQLTVVICGFVLPRYMLLYFGSSLNGLVSSISHFLNFITFLEMGVGAVVQSNLYAPLADKCSTKISEIFLASERFFRKIAFIFIGYIVVLLFVFPNLINNEYNWFFTASLIVIISISLFEQYYFGISYQLLLNADQKSYIQNTVGIITVILNTVFCIALMQKGKSIHVVKLVSALVYLLQPIFLASYVKKNYLLDRKVKIVGEPIKQKWNGFSQHLASIVCNNVDVVVLTLFSTLTDVSIYSVYYSVTNGVTQIILTGAMGLESLFGSMLARREKDKLLVTFEAAEWTIHFCATVLYTIMAILIIPFVRVYTVGITDANYIVPGFGIMLALAYGCMCIRIPYFRMIKAAGHYKQTEKGAYISVFINIVLSVVLVFPFGLPGIAFGTLAALLYHTCYFVNYLRKNIICRPIKYFVRYLVLDTLTGLLGFILAIRIEIGELSYYAWFIMAIKVSVVTIVIAGLIQVLLNRKTTKEVVYLMLGTRNKE
ncbi:polysaccharide biosynthesis C-terminal domain-containing protein [Ruthenibacterium lactatiformans]|uniref:polysaccharide biosynthesis C-terminal domain-containing protein n=1 Tax=Ruthenibacterium lactatiformans TaxID=1550024 RepID=UPI0032C1262B